ncbi:MAG: SDR family NAD(P)-dependent oxidoreductase, partial [Gammaproteobacteria bacterium]|nr:SDR family NAD(P)-dependent oxidoreductase [Gammaproteobacteria bacterium]
MLLKAQIALVTGASRGIGQTIALELGRQGAQVIGTATSPEGAEKISNALKENNIAGKGVVLDVNNTDSIAAVLADMEKNGGAPTILVNNAGITRDNLLLRMTEEEWDAILDTNLKSVYRLSKACLRAMMKAR